LLVPADTSSALGEGILEVLRDPVLRRRLADNGHQYVRAHHDRRLMADALCASYRKALAAQGRSIPTNRPRLRVRVSSILASQEVSPSLPDRDNSPMTSPTKVVSHVSA
jgi:hypothetical protein